MSLSSEHIKTLKSKSASKIGTAGMADTAGVTRPNVWETFANTSKDSYGVFFEMRPVDRAGLIKSGAPASLLTRIAKDMDFPRDRVARLIGVPPATANRKLAKNANLSNDESERLVGLTKLIGQVEDIVLESGDSTNFEPAKWFSSWIQTPMQALGGRKPEEFLDTSDGREAVASLLAQMQSGAYA